MRQYSLAHLTVLSLAPPEMIRVAARCGYNSVGLRLIQVTPESPGYALMRDKAMLRETLQAMRETGVHVNDIEFVKLTPEIDVVSLEPFFEVGAELGAKYAIAAPYDPDLRRLADRFAAFCDIGSIYGISGMLEFFPWTVVPGLKEANAIVDDAGRENAGILVDMLHFDRSHSTFAQLDHIAPERLPFVHLCDAPALHPTTTEGLLHHARGERLPPGMGGLDIKGLLAHLPPEIAVALEVPMETLTREIGADSVAKLVIDATRQLLDK